MWQHEITDHVFVVPEPPPTIPGWFWLLFIVLVIGGALVRLLELQTIFNWQFQIRQVYMKNKKLVVIVSVMALLLISVVGAFAQETVELNVDSSSITSNLFQGANIIIGALLAIMMLVAGFKFGRDILEQIVSSITKR